MISIESARSSRLLVNINQWICLGNVFDDKYYTALKVAMGTESWGYRLLPLIRTG